MPSSLTNTRVLFIITKINRHCAQNERGNICSTAIHFLICLQLPEREKGGEREMKQVVLDVSFFFPKIG